MEGECIGGHLWTTHQAGYNDKGPVYYAQCERCGKVKDVGEY